MKKYFKFNTDGEEVITALIVGSKTEKAKFILHVPKETSGNTIFRVIKLLDRKFRHAQAKKFFSLENTKRLVYPSQQLYNLGVKSNHNAARG